MSWTEFLKRAAPGAKQSDIAKAAGVTGPTVSRWLNGQQGVDPIAAATFARHHGLPVLEAFVAAGFLTAAEAKVRPAAAPDFSQLTNDELLELVRARMGEESGSGAYNASAMNAAGESPRHLAVAQGGGTPDEAAAASKAAAEERAKQEEAQREMDEKLRKKRDED